MTTYGLDFGTTTTYLTDRSTGEVIHIPLGGNKGRVGPNDGDAIFSRVKASANGELTSGVIDGDRSLKTMLTGSPDTDVDRKVEALLKTVIQIALEKSKKDLTKSNTVQLCCPAFWERDTRDRLLRIAQKAGLGLVEETPLIEEPIAAGLAWIDGNQAAALNRGLTFVFDMGGGTLDVAVLDAQKNKDALNVYVLASAGNQFAGDWVDNVLLEKAKALAAGNDFDDYLINRVEAAKQLLASDKSKASADVVLKEGSSKSVTLSQGDLQPAYAPILNQAEALVNETLKVAYIWDLLRHSGIGPNSQLPGSTGELEESFFEPKFPSWLIEEARNVPIEDLRGSVKNVILSGGMSNSLDIQNYLKKAFPKADFYLGADQIGKHKPNSASRLVSMGIGSDKNFSSLNFARPDFDIMINNQVIYEAFTPLISLDEIASAPPAIRRVARGMNGGLVSIRTFGQKNSKPMKDAEGNEVFLPSVDRTILYPDGTFVAFENSGRRVEVSSMGYTKAGFADRYDPQIDLVELPTGGPRYERDTHDFRKPAKARALAPSCEALQVERHLVTRKQLGEVWPGVKYLQTYIQVLEEICQVNPRGASSPFLQSLDHEANSHLSCHTKWYAFWLANMCLLGWKVSTPHHIQPLEKFSNQSDAKSWSKDWFDRDLFTIKNQYTQPNI